MVWTNNDGLPEIYLSVPYLSSLRPSPNTFSVASEITDSILPLAPGTDRSHIPLVSHLDYRAICLWSQEMISLQSLIIVYEEKLFNFMKFVEFLNNITNITSFFVWFYNESF